MPKAGEEVDKQTRQRYEESGPRVSKQDKQASGCQRSRRTLGQKEGRHDGSLNSKESSLQSERPLEARVQDNTE